jgi:hypothetical protein
MNSQRIAIGTIVKATTALKGGAILEGCTGVVEQDDGTPNFPYFVRFDVGLCHWCDEAELMLLPTTTGYYQPLTGIPHSVPVLDEDADELSTGVTADVPEEVDYLAITRNFCR